MLIALALLNHLQEEFQNKPNCEFKLKNHKEPATEIIECHINNKIYCKIYISHEDYAVYIYDINEITYYSLYDSDCFDNTFMKIRKQIET